MPEVAQDAGILVDPHDLDAIQHALLRLIEDGSLKQSLASKGMDVSKQFSWSKTAASTAEIYSLFA